MTGLYIHIPFCASRCIYCGFYSTTLSQLKQKYTDAICREMELRKQNIDKRPIEISTIYFGGGTPSQLTKEQLQQIFSSINSIWNCNGSIIRKNCEITFECNPDDITEDFANFIAYLGVNRVSMGAQTFDPARLKFLHRRHNANEVKLAVDRLKSAGFDNISIDLMFGFPGETLTEWEEDIKTAVSLEPKHISAYSLMYEEGTPLYRMLEKGEIEEIDEETSLAMYKKLIDLLTQAGYEHYEISNFARPGFRSQHNSSYWNAIPYIGIGAAAHSYSKDYRSWNVDNIHQYIQSIHDNKLPSESEYLDATTRYNDLITTALRTREGINLTKLKDEYGEELFLYLTQEAQKYINLHEMKIEDNKLSLTRKGLYISDSIMSDLIFISNIK